MNTESGNHLLDRAAIATDQVAAQALGATQRGVAAMRNSSQHLLERAHQASDHTSAYVRGEPVKALLIAAAAGAALMALIGLVTRSRS